MSCSASLLLLLQRAKALEQRRPRHIARVEQRAPPALGALPPQHAAVLRRRQRARARVPRGEEAWWDP